MLAWLRQLPEEAYLDRISTPVGRMMLIASQKGLHAFIWETEGKTAAERKVFARMSSGRALPVIVEAKKQLREYFAGKRKGFDLPLRLEGTEFQRKAWRELQRIPYGRTISYGEQAKRLGVAKGTRAVGTANGKNPIAIIVPCHRVVARGGKLGGYGGGLPAKRTLLALEEAKFLK